MVEKVPEKFLATVKTYLAELSSGGVVPEPGCRLEQCNLEIDEAEAEYRD